jgi:hypothetical protein
MLAKKVILAIFILAGILLVFYFSWLPSPDISIQPYLPKWLGSWTNQNDNLRTAVPFVFLGLTGELILFNNRSIWYRRTLVLFSLVLIVTLAELGQLFLPKRHFDLWDIFWGMAGALGGMILGATCKRILNRPYKNK